MSRDSTLLKALGLLDLIGEEKGSFTIEYAMENNGLTRSTAYRYIKDLTDAGLLSSHAGRYSLGSRIIAMERIHALTDPLVRAGRQCMPKTRDGANRAYLLNSIYNRQALCVFFEGPDRIRNSAGDMLDIVRAKGASIPLYQGAASLAMMAYLPVARAKDIYLNNHEEIAARGLGRSWQEFRTLRAELRERGFVTALKSDPTLLSGLAVPVRSPEDGRLYGSLSLVFSLGAEGAPEDIERSAAELREIASSIAAAYEAATAADEASGPGVMPSD